MADPKAIVPYSDPYESPEDILNLMDFRNPTLEDLRIQEQPTVAQSNDTSGDPVDLFDDPDLWDQPGNQNTMNSQSSASNFAGGGTRSQSEGIWTTEESRLIPDWPSEPVPFVCSCCQVLRELIHTNGIEITKLEIHGRLGIICHAILDVYTPTSLYSASVAHQYRMFDFCKMSIEDVKQFLVQYCLERKQAGFSMIPDPLSMFYEALCVGAFWDDAHSDPLQPSTSNAETSRVDQPTVVCENEQDRISNSAKSSLAAQRERTGKLTIKDIGDYFHLPIEEAAKRMRLCPTVVKKICRRDGLSRWPHRKIKALERQISNWAVTLETSKDPNEVARAQIEIQGLQQELAKIREASI